MGIQFDGNLIINVMPNSQAKPGVACGWKIVKVNGVIQPNETESITKAIDNTFLSHQSTEILFHTFVPVMGNQRDRRIKKKNISHCTEARLD